MGSTSVEQFPVQTRLPWAGERRDQPKCLGGTVGSVICIHGAGRRNICFAVLARHLNAPRRGSLIGDGGNQVEPSALIPGSPTPSVCSSAREEGAVWE